MPEVEKIIALQNCIKHLLDFVDDRELDIALSVNENMEDPRISAKKILEPKKKKKINLVIEGCKECPYCDYCDDDYLSGWFCIKESYIFRGTNLISTLNPKLLEVPLPEWCPLEDVEKKD